MNINVGIELGYAIRAHGEEQVLLVLNEHYGGREYLPFHLQDLAGPITYNLPADTSKDQIAGEMSKLRGQFVVAIREFLRKTRTPEKSSVHFSTRSFDHVCCRVVYPRRNDSRFR